MREFDLLFILKQILVLFAYLHNGCVLPDPVMERGGKLFKLLKLFLRLRIKERVAGWRLWDEDLDSEECWRLIYLGTRHTTGRHT